MHMHVRHLLLIFYLEFHLSINNHNTKPENTGVQCDSVDIYTVLDLIFQKMYFVLKKKKKTKPSSRHVKVLLFHQDIQELL